METEGKELLLKIDPRKNLDVHTSDHTADKRNAACIFQRWRNIENLGQLAVQKKHYFYPEVPL